VTETQKAATNGAATAVGGFAFLCAALAAATGLGQATRSPDAQKSALVAIASAPADLSGRWELNARACEPIQDPHDPGQGNLHPQVRGKSTLSGASREEMRRVAEAQPVLVISQTEAGLTVTDGEGRAVALRADGVSVKDRPAGDALERTSKWQGRTLVSEARLSNDAHVVQTYATRNERLQLVITTTVEGGRSLNALSFKWVYDQALQ
jgi:hypothetical protein